MARHFTPPCMLGCHPKPFLLASLLRRNGPPFQPSLHAWLSPQTLLACMLFICLVRGNGPPFHPSLHAWLSSQTRLAYMLCEAKWPTISHFIPPCMLGCHAKLSFLACLVRRNGPPFHPSLRAWLSCKTLLEEEHEW